MKINTFSRQRLKPLVPDVIGTDGFSRRKKMPATDGFSRRKKLPTTDGFSRRKKMPATDGFSRRRDSGFGFTCRLKNLAVVILVLFSIPAFSQPSYKIIPDVVYGHKAGMALTYDVFLPVDSANGAAIIHVVSGGWNSRYHLPDTVVVNYLPYLEKGFTVFALRHGSSPKFTLPEAVDDVTLGAWHIHGHAADYGLDSNRIGIFGGSSGGQLALMAALAGDRHPVDAVVAFFAPSDLRNVPDFLTMMIPALDFDSAYAEKVSPVLFASPDDPPVLLIHGDKDFVVAPWHSEKMYDALQENKVESRLIIYPGMMHGNSYGAKSKYYEEARQEVIDWFTLYLLHN